MLSGGEPRLVDEAQGGELRAREIRIGTRSRAVAASENVRHTTGRREKGGRGPARRGRADGGAVPAVRLRRRDARRRATVRHALMRSGKDEIRAPLIEIEEPVGGARRLTASGGVGSVAPPAGHEGGEAGPAADRDAQPRAGLRREGAAGRVHGRRRDPAGRHPDQEPRGDRAAERGREDDRARARRRARRGAPGRAPRDAASGARTRRATRRSCWSARRSCCRTRTAGSRAGR